MVDTNKIEGEYNLNIWQGINYLYPKTFIKVALLALRNCCFSLRKIEEDTTTNITYRWLTGNKTIDRSTIGRFLNQFKTEIVELFSQVVEIVMGRNLLDFDILAIDTVKVRANAIYKQIRDLEGLKKEIEKIKHRLQELFKDAEHLDKQEEATLTNVNTAKERS